MKYPLEKTLKSVMEARVKKPRQGKPKTSHNSRSIETLVPIRYNETNCQKRKGKTIYRGSVKSSKRDVLSILLSSNPSLNKNKKVELQGSP